MKKHSMKLQLHRETLVLLSQIPAEDLAQAAGGTTYGCTLGTCDLNRCLNRPTTITIA